MHEVYNVYCDESCHLEHDHQSVMLLGAVWCPQKDVRRISLAIRELKLRCNAKGELKWMKVSKSRRDFYLALLDLFLGDPVLNFRCLVVDNKSRLNHAYFNSGSHDSFYYKMYFFLLRNLIKVDSEYYIYVDRKDTRSELKVRTLRDVLSYNFHDFEQNMVKRIQQIRSEESELLQLADLLMGAVSYRWRSLSRNDAKVAVADTIARRLGLDLLRSTPPWEEKFNLFVFTPKNVPVGERGQA